MKPSNKPVADFCCEDCHNDFELKSKNQVALGKVIISPTCARSAQNLCRTYLHANLWLGEDCHSGLLSTQRHE